MEPTIQVLSMNDNDDLSLCYLYSLRLIKVVSTKTDVKRIKREDALNIEVCTL